MQASLPSRTCLWQKREPIKITTEHNRRTETVWLYSPITLWFWLKTNTGAMLFCFFRLETDTGMTRDRVTAGTSGAMLWPVCVAAGKFKFGNTCLERRYDVMSLTSHALTLAEDRRPRGWNI